MNNKRISIALCTYNGTQYLQEQLDSIVCQTRLPDEMIVCDDCSQDNTVDIVEKFASNVSFPVHLVINEQNIGSTQNFENAIRMCKGDIIALSDQDDVWLPDKLETVENFFSMSRTIGIVFSDAEVVDEHLQPLGYNVWESIGFNQTEQKHFTTGRTVDILLKHNVMTGATMAFRSEFKDIILPIPSVWVHDGWIALLIANIANVGMIPKPLIKYRQHSAQQIGASNSRKKTIYSKAQWIFYKIFVEGVDIDSNIFLNMLDQYQLAYEHLINHCSISEDVKSKFEAKIVHLRKRVNMHERKLLRLPFIFKELLTLRYHRYSYGFYSIGEDIFR